MIQPSQTLVRLSAFALLILLPVVVSPWAAESYSLPKALTLYGLTGLMLVGWIGSYAVGRSPKWVATSAEFPMWVFVLLVLISTWMTVDARATFLGAFGRNEGLPTILAYVVLFVVGVHFFGSRDGLNSLARVLVVTALLVSAYGVVRLWVPPLFAGEAWLEAYYGSASLRIFSLVGGPNVYGAYLSVAAPFAVGLFVTEQRRLLAPLWLIAGLLAIGSAFLTMTRAAWLGMLFGGAAFLAVQGWTSLHTYRRRLLVMLAVLAVGGAVLITTFAAPGRVLARARSAIDLQSESTAQRLYIWKQTIAVIRQRPLFGWGLETLGQVFPYRRAELVTLFGLVPPFIDRAHNDILHTAASVGLPGAIAYLAFWIVAILVAVRLVRRTDGLGRVLAAAWLGGLVGYLVQVQFSFSSVAVTPIVWLLAGSAAGWEAVDGGR